jgi:hypothetical protein
MASRCEHCRHWVDTVFKGSSASGWGVWWGDCHHPAATGPRNDDHHSLYLACRKFEAGAHPNSLNAAAAAKPAAPTEQDAE